MMACLTASRGTPTSRPTFSWVNPPFSISDRGGERLGGDKRWLGGAFQQSSDHRMFPGPHAGALYDR